MKLARLVLYLAVGFVLRSLVLLLWGNGGLSDYRQALAARSALAVNIEQLKQINSRLRREVESLSSDPERIVLEARRLGYYREGERVVRFEADPAPRSSFVLGTLVRVNLSFERRDWIWKLLGIALPVAAFILTWVRQGRGQHAPGRR